MSSLGAVSVVLSGRHAMDRVACVVWSQAHAIAGSLTLLQFPGTRTPGDSKPATRHGCTRGVIGEFSGLRHCTGWRDTVPASVRLGHPFWKVSVLLRRASLQNAMTSSAERTSAEAEGYRIERSLMD